MIVFELDDLIEHVLVKNQKSKPVLIKADYIVKNNKFNLNLNEIL